MDYLSSHFLQLHVQLNGKQVSELTQLAVRGKQAASKARAMADLLAREIPRQQFLIKVQVLQGQTSIASAAIKPYRKDTTHKLASCFFLFDDCFYLQHAADPTRWKKKLQDQIEGKKRMRQFGNIVVPRDTFINVFKNDVS
ncbi:hypothetical protein Ciccas_004794 [Cichlidogyrus casuarinus]|uniref:GTP-binding protein LepA C-terminal domain-containing protein n=1 Tax=Cichlidogyrus casuarinus TaxID=1844966 RepID=A0ABD2QAG6_9PLAT